jgi:hypothetical protein
MLVDFEQLSDTSKVWIYQSDRPFTAMEEQEISKKLENFLSTWKRHGDDLKASYQIKYNHFIIISADETHHPVSGCSIDASTNFIKQLEKEYQIELLNKINTAFRVGEHINVVPLSSFKQFASERKIDHKTIVFNNVVNTIRDLNEQWEIEAGKSWHQRFLN